MKQWQAIDTTDAKYIGQIEIQNGDDWEHFTVVKTDTHLVFGGVCNVGLLESGNYEIDLNFDLDTNLQELIEDLEAYYFYGKGCQSDAFTCNDRM